MITVNRLQWTLIHCVWLPCVFEEFSRLTNSLLHFVFTQIVHMQLAKHWNLRKYIQNTIYIYIKALMRVCVCKPTQPADSCGDCRACGLGTEEPALLCCSTFMQMRVHWEHSVCGQLRFANNNCVRSLLVYNNTVVTDTRLCHTVAAFHMPVAKRSCMVVPQTANHISKGLNFGFAFHVRLEITN